LLDDIFQIKAGARPEVSAANTQASRSKWAVDANREGPQLAEPPAVSVGPVAKRSRPLPAAETSQRENQPALRRITATKSTR